MDRRKFCAGMLAAPALFSGAGLSAQPAVSSGQPALWGRERKLRFTLHDPLYHPHIWWPRTLLSYPVLFEGPASLDHLVLTQVGTGAQVPIQFSNVVSDDKGIRAATLNFFSDLPSGGHREFELSLAAAPNSIKPQVSERTEGTSIVLDSGVLRARIPATQIVAGDAPGPIQQLSRNGTWIGDSVLAIDGDKVVRITTKRIEHGPLFITYEISYVTRGNSRYVARVQCIGGFDFVRFHEDMEGIKPGIRGMLTSRWTGFHATHRQAPNHPTPLPPKVLPYEQYNWERIDAPFFFNNDAIQLPPGQLPFNLGIYQTWTAFHSDTSANFWDEKSNDALGVFIDDPVAWQDHEYASHTEAETLQVKFHYQDGRFSWQWPIARGSRASCVMFYDHAKDKEAQRALDAAAAPIEKDGLSYRGARALTSHAMFLQNRYSTLDLNKFKDWVLEYPDTARRPKTIFEGGQVRTADELENRIMTSEYVSTLALLGTRENGGMGPIPGRNITNFSPVPSRQLQAWWIDAFNRLAGSMNDRQRKRLTAIYLFMGYIHAGEDFMPVIPMLSGHPNFLPDVKGNCAAMSFLFPDHPMAATWTDLWQKSMEINTRYNTRPTVHAWDAEGGRWTENLGTYVWAFLRSTLRTDFLLRNYDGRERFLSPELAAVAGWLVNSLTAPFAGENPTAYKDLQTLDQGHEWGAVPPCHAPVRVHPTQGAHAERRIPPRSMWYFGTCLQNYSPLAAEHAMWAARPTSQDMETPAAGDKAWDAMVRGKENAGTKPQLRSGKYTGYGIVLRAAVDTPDEISIHLQQIDQGPNYRWGISDEGGCGVIHYYADGKCYSTTGTEDVGDRADQDTDFCSNFGVFKDGTFRCIGMNVLERPFYDLGVAQFAELTPRQKDEPYATPEYISRSILLAGHEYFVLYDQVVTASLIHRLSWFVREGDDLPMIKILRGEGGTPRLVNHTEIKTSATHGIWFDGEGDSLAVISHRKDVDAKATEYGCRVKCNGGEDIIFRNPVPVEFYEGENHFHGTAGMIRMRKDVTEFALFHGTQIAVDGISIATKDTDLGISGSVTSGTAMHGEYYAPNSSTAQIMLASAADTVRFYIDGRESSVQHESNTLVVTLAAGRHHWELTASLPVPMPPIILRTENHSGGAVVVLAPADGASQYRIDVSSDNGASWSHSVTTSQPVAEINGLRNGQKYHLRAIAANAAHESAPSAEYPLYVSAEAPHVPDGLHVDLAAGAATVTWGEVLGAKEYRLYMRRQGTKEYSLLYRGLDRSFVHVNAGIRSSNAVPLEGPRLKEIFEYMVSASNANGESAMSPAADSDPASWRNWDPRPGEKFRRVASFEPDTPPSASPWPRYYPE